MKIKIIVKEIQPKKDKQCKLTISQQLIYIQIVPEQWTHSQFSLILLQSKNSYCMKYAIVQIRAVVLTVFPLISCVDADYSLVERYEVWKRLCVDIAQQ